MKTAKTMKEITANSNKGFTNWLDKIDREVTDHANNGHTKCQVSGVPQAIHERVIDELTLLGFKSEIANGNTIIMIDWS